MIPVLVGIRKKTTFTLGVLGRAFIAAARSSFLEKNLQRNRPRQCPSKAEESMSPVCVAGRFPALPALCASRTPQPSRKNSLPLLTATVSRTKLKALLTHTRVRLGD